jgi:hypothetical protein
LDPPRLLAGEAMGAWHLPRPPPRHVNTYLNEYVFRYNRRFYRHVSFATILGLAASQPPISRWDIVGRDNPRKGRKIKRLTKRRRRLPDREHYDVAGRLGVAGAGVDDIPF